MSGIVNAYKAADHFLSALVGIEVHYELPDGRCGGSPNAASIGYCSHVGPHGPHAADEKPTYREPRNG